MLCVVCAARSRYHRHCLLRRGFVGHCCWVPRAARWCVVCAVCACVRVACSRSVLCLVDVLLCDLRSVICVSSVASRQWRRVSCGSPPPAMARMEMDIKTIKTNTRSSRPHLDSESIWTTNCSSKTKTPNPKKRASSAAPPPPQFRAAFGTRDLQPPAAAGVWRVFVVLLLRGPSPAGGEILFAACWLVAVLTTETHMSSLGHLELRCSVMPAQVASGVVCAAIWICHMALTRGSRHLRCRQPRCRHANTYNWKFFYPTHVHRGNR
jgi:hypothetical protein